MSMGVYIENMEMPTSPVLFCVHPDGKVFADLEGGWREYKAVPVQPHRRLIDAVMLRHKCYQHYEDFMNGKIDGETALLNIEKEIIGAPTIIPAESITTEEEKNDK